MDQRLLIAGMLEAFPGFRAICLRFEEMSYPDEPEKRWLLRRFGTRSRSLRDRCLGEIVSPQPASPIST